MLTAFQWHLYKCWNNFGTIFLGHTPPLSSHMCHGEKLDCIWFYTGRWPSIIISPWMISTVGWYSCYSHRTLKGSCNAAMLLQPWWPRWRKGAGAKPPHWDLMIWSTNVYSNFDMILGQLPQSKIIKNQSSGFTNVELTSSNRGMFNTVFWWFLHCKVLEHGRGQHS